MSKLWFKRKRYGYGWVPATLEGWLVTFGYIALFVIAEIVFIGNIENHRDSSYIFFFILAESLLTAALIYICYKKGEKPRWSWGDQNEENKEGKTLTESQDNKR